MYGASRRRQQPSIQAAIPAAIQAANAEVERG